MLRDVLAVVVLLTALFANVRWMLMSHDAASNPALTMVLLGPAEQRPRPPVLLVAMVTVPRAGDANYVETALTSLIDEAALLPPGVGQIAVAVNNMRPGQHAVIDRMQTQERFSNVTFREIIPRNASSTALNSTWEGIWGPMTLRAYQLNLDLLDFLGSVHWDCYSNGVEHVLVVEDDFVWCPFALAHVFRAMDQAQHRPNAVSAPFLALRVSFGNNGLVLRCSDLPSIITLGERYKLLGPLDSFLGEVLPSAALEPDEAVARGRAESLPALPPSWRGRPYFTYRYNVMEHIGHVSARLDGGAYGGAFGGGGGNGSSGRPPSWGLAGAHRKLWTAEELRGSQGRLCYPHCFGLIQYVGLMPMENFADACLASVMDDLSPCPCPANLAKTCRGLHFSDVLDRVELNIRSGLC